MTGVSIKGVDELQSALTQLAALGGGNQDVLMAMGLKMQQQISETFQSGADPVSGATWPSLSSISQQTRRGGRPLRKTNQLLRSLVSSMPDVTNDGVRVTTNLSYAATHQYGATIRPNNAKYLAIPLTRKAEKMGSPRRLSNAVFKPTKGGGFMVFEGRGREPQFLLTKGPIEIPQRRFLGFNEQYIRQLLDIVLAKIDAIWRGDGSR